jgi:membrane dipeptidase
MKRSLLISMAVVSLTVWAANLAAGEISKHVMSLHGKAFVFDAHCDTAMRLIGERAIDLGERLETGHMDLPRMAAGGLDAQIFACWPNPRLPREQYVKETLQMIDAVWEQARRHGDRFEVALRGRDVKRISKAGRVAAIIGIEGGHAILEDLGILRDYHRLGVRCMTLTWMNTNGWADSSDDTTKWGGLNEFGREVVREMDRLDMIIDCSHVSDSTFFDVIETTRNPVLVSHSCTRALCDIPRNVSDDELRALAENGGVICINYFPGFIDKGYYERASEVWQEFGRRRQELTDRYGGDRARAWEELRTEYDERMGAIHRPSIGVLVDHIDHAVRIAGIDHVGLGSDFDGISVLPAGMEDVADLPAITAELKKRGYSDRDVRKILGGNLLGLVERVMK